MSVVPATGMTESTHVCVFTSKYQARLAGAKMKWLGSQLCVSGNEMAEGTSY